MTWTRAAILNILLFPAAAVAQPAPSWAVAAGPGLLGGGFGLVVAHLRFGPEWMPEQGLGAGLDAGWLCAAPIPWAGVGTVSPTVIYSLGRGRSTTVSLRAGYTFLVGDPDRVVHAGVAFDRDFGRRGRLRVEVRDNVFLGGGALHAVELTLGWVAP